MWKFAVDLQQQQSGNNSSSCFNWFEAAGIARGSGEALSIKQMVERMMSDHASVVSCAHRLDVAGPMPGQSVTRPTATGSVLAGSSTHR
ncbi:MAG: hypothetical protein R3F08_16605 [Dokdonella sp.]